MNETQNPNKKPEAGREERRGEVMSRWVGQDEASWDLV